MKRILLILVGLSIIFVLSGCFGGGNSSVVEATPVPTATPMPIGAYDSFTTYNEDEYVAFLNGLSDEYHVESYGFGSGSNDGGSHNYYQVTYKKVK
jgi:hypothetical protein